jgi:hypothetical protein
MLLDLWSVPLRDPYLAVDHRREVRFGKEAIANVKKLTFGLDSHKAVTLVFTRYKRRSA